MSIGLIGGSLSERKLKIITPIDPLAVTAALLALYSAYPGTCVAIGLMLMVFMLCLGVSELTARLKQPAE
ncbi:hypothetical protein [Pseudomonas sp. NPDC096950]|uniref:hypothetical protein n=1 Tax=Pseudomonas sp. NPDC096950 TaxID=3364485 RepID=UPI00383B1313